MSSTVFDVLTRRLEEKQEATALFLAQGGAKSYEDYVRIVGEYAATTSFLVEIKELERRFIDD
jgi:hypothetical protein